MLIGFFTLMDVLTEHYSPGFAGRPAMLRVKRAALTGAAWLISLLFCVTGGFPLLKDPTRCTGRCRFRMLSPWLPA